MKKTLDIVTTLRGTELFDGLDDAALNVVAGIAEVIRLGDGGTLISEGYAQSHDLYLIIDGLFDVITRRPDKPDEAMTLGNLRYEVVGEIGWLMGSGRTATVRCRGEMHAIRIDGPRLMTFLEQRPEVGFQVMRHLMRSLATKLVDANFFLM
jgi:CRP-like cAMP-binding protein